METTQDTRGRGKNKRKRKHAEDMKLVETLLDMVNLGMYKAENGFKHGYLNYVEDKMQTSLPISGLKAKPHIESRIKTLKRDFHIVYDMSHPTHASWQNKSFPFYDDLITIFGKDRGIGINAEGPTDMMEEIQREEANNDTNNGVEPTNGDGLDDLDASISFSPLQSPRSEVSHNQKKRKRSVDNLTIMADIKEATSIIGSEIAKASQVFGKAIGVDAEISEKKQNIDSEIRKIPNLTIGEIIKAVCHIAQSHELTDVFFSMMEERREQIVKVILRGDI